MHESRSTTKFSETDVQAMLRELRHIPEKFATLFSGESEATLHHRPANEWSAVEIVAHLADHDAFERSQRFEVVLAEDRPELPEDETRFEVARSNYQELSAAEALEFFERERGLTIALLENLGPRDWVRIGILPTDDERSLLQIADLRDHDREHLEQAVAVIASAKP